MRDEWSDLVEQIRAEEGNRGLGAVHLASGRALERYSRAGHEGAQNLVDKAMDALAAGDRDRARRYLGTASRLPFDEREQSHPLAWVVHLELFNLVSDTMEDADEHDSRWLTAAIDLLAETEEAGRSELRHVLASIDHDYGLGRKQSRALRDAIADVPERPALPDERLDSEELVASALLLLDLCLAYGARMERGAD